ncbi:hypothetical protein U9331_25395, partial [Escherichia coli]
MKDLTLKFPGNREFKSFLSSLDWEEDEDLQNKLLVDEIGFTYTETGVTEEGEPVCLNRPGFPGECFICELRLPDHRFRWKHNKLFLLLPEEYGPAFPA